MSPIRYVRDIDVPMLILHSEDDLRCPISQAEELFVALRLLGKDVTFYRFPGESHELSRSRLAGAPPHARRDHPRLLHREAAAAPQGPRWHASTQASASQSSISLRAIEMPGGIIGRSSRRYQPASAISVASSTISPDSYRARKPIIRLCGNGHGWLPW